MSDGINTSSNSDANEASPAFQPATQPRRGFLKSLGLGAGALGLTGTGLTGTAEAARAARSARIAPAVTAAPTVTDADIMNFALNLEYLEAEYYTYAVTGSGIEALGISTTGLNTGAGGPGPISIKTSPQVNFQIPAIQQYAVEIAIDEQKHVQFFRNTLAAFGAQPVARPAINLRESFAALGAMIGVPGFDPFVNDLTFLLGAYIFEDVGVSAFHGAARLIKNKDVLDAAAGILGIEAYHAGLIRTALFAMGQGPNTQAISEVRKMLGDSVDYGVAQGPLGMGPAGHSSIVLADSNAIAASRTARQVLNIVYGGVNAVSGLFFPNGLNGNIR